MCGFAEPSLHGFLAPRCGTANPGYPLKAAALGEQKIERGVHFSVLVLQIRYALGRFWSSWRNPLPTSTPLANTTHASQCVEVRRALPSITSYYYSKLYPDLSRAYFLPTHSLYSSLEFFPRIAYKKEIAIADTEKKKDHDPPDFSWLC